MAGASTSAIFSLPNFLCSSNQPSTQPGTLTGSGPNDGMALRPFSFRYASVNDFGDLPDALSPWSFCVLASQTMANKSPPTPLPVGSIRPRQALAAMAASTAEPPRFSTSSPTCVASGWLVQTMPFWAITSERVANARPVTRSWPKPARETAHNGKRSKYRFFMRTFMEA